MKTGKLLSEVDDRRITVNSNSIQLTEIDSLEERHERINDYSRLSQSELLDYINNLEMMLLEEIGKGVKLRFEIEDMSKSLARAEKDANFHKSLHEVYASVIDAGLIHAQSKHPHLKLLKSQLY